MKKKLLAGILALALCSTNMPPQTIFAGEFTSGTPEAMQFHKHHNSWLNRLVLTMGRMMA